MEGYQNYQDIINAIKAEYVNARNLKKTATAKKRVATNAKSFKTRKENEKSTLETKLTSVENLLESNLETSFNNLEDARFETLKSELSELNGKLAFIDADIIRLENRHSEDPGNIGTSPTAAKTPIESQSLTLLRNMLSVTIADAELVITNLYGGQDYSAIKSAVIPTQMTNTQQEVRSYYLDLQSTFNQLFDKTKTELDLFVFDMLTAGGEVNQKTQWLIGYSNDLFTFKSQLADLLTNEGTEAEINAKEQEIEDIKEEMLTRAADLKMIEISIGNRMSNAKMEKLRRYATDLNTLTEELTNYRQENNEFLRHEIVEAEGDIQYKSFELYSGIFEFLDSNQWLDTSRGFQNGQWTEFKLVKEQITEAKNRYRGDIKYRNNAHSDIQILDQPSRIFDCDQSNNNNGTEYYNIKDFLPGVSEDAKEFYVNYSRQLHVATKDYVYEKSVYKSSKNAIQWRISDFEEILDKQSRNIAALGSTKMQLLGMERETQEKSNGHYEGTSEQHVALDNTRGTWFEAEAEYLRQFYTNRSKSNRFDLFESIFPEFYSTLSGLQSNLSQSNTNLTSSDTTLSDLITSKHAAYDYLQTLTVGEAEYTAALADYEAKVAAYDLAFTEVLNKKDGPGGSEEANSFLQTTLAGEAQYQVAKDNVDAKMAELDLLGANYRALQQAGFVLQNELNILISAGADQSLIDAKQAEIDANGVAARAERDAIEPQGNILNNEGNILAAILSSLQPLHYVYLGAQSDYDTKLAAKDAYYSDVVAPAEVLKNDAYTFLQTLTDEDADYQAALTDWNSKEDAQNLFYNETYMPAQDAYTSAALELDQYLSSNHGSEFNLSYSASTLKGFKDEYFSSQESLQQAESAKPTTQAAFMDVRNGMTFVESTPLEKRQGIWKFKEMREKHEQVERLESLATRYSEIFPQMINQVSQRVNEVRYRDEAFFASKLQNVKDFLDGEHINNLGRNLYSDKLNEEKVGEIQSQKNRTILESIFIPLLQDWNMRFGSDNNTNENIANVYDNAINRLQIYGSGIDTLQQKIYQINNKLFRQFDGFSFADRIINEVNNGTPLI